MKHAILLILARSTPAMAKQVITVPGQDQDQDLRETIAVADISKGAGVRAGYPPLWKTPEWLEAYRLCGQNPFNAPKYRGMDGGLHVFVCR